jgi:DNA-binding MarR family transcriptional regulator
MHDIIHLIHLAHQRAYEAWAAPKVKRPTPTTPCVTRSQAAVLQAVAAEPGLSQTVLVERTGIDRSTLSDIVRRMCGARMLKRGRTKDDARVHAVTLGPKGEDALAVANALSAEANAALTRHMTAAQTQSLVDALRLLYVGNPCDRAAERAA